MMTHFSVVLSSLAVTFMDMITESMKKKDFKQKDQKMTPEQIERDRQFKRIQSIFGRIQSRPVPKGVWLNLHLNPEETTDFVEAIKKKIAEEKINLKRKKMSALHNAIQAKDMSGIERWLKDKDIDFNLADMSGLYSIHVAAGYADTKLFMEILQKTADIHARSKKENQTALHHAAIHGQLTYIRTLLLLKLDINAVDNDGKSALHCAVENNHGAVVRFLLEKGADKSLKNIKEQTALDIAKELNYPEIVKLLEK